MTAQVTDPRTAAVKEVFVTIDGARHYGAYLVQGSTVCVRSSYGMKVSEVGVSTPEAIAKQLLSEMIAQKKPAAGSTGRDEGEEASALKKFDDITAPVEAGLRSSDPAESTSVEMRPVEDDHEAPAQNQPRSPWADVELDTAIRLRWALRDIRAKRTLTPVSSSDLRTLVEMGLVELRDDASTLTNEGHQALDQ